MLLLAFRSLIEAPGGVRMLDWHSDELDGAIRHADVVVVDVPPNLHERTFGVINGRFLGRTVVLQEGEHAEALPPGPPRAVLYRPLQIAELWAAITGAQPVAPPALPEPAEAPEDEAGGSGDDGFKADADAAPADPEKTEPGTDAGDDASMQGPGLPVAESGLLIGLSGRELEPVVGPGQVAPGMDEETLERLRRWGSRSGQPPSGTAGTRRANGTRAGRAKPASAEARREQSRRRRAARAEARAATREEVARQREARAAAREQARQARAAEAAARKAAQEGARRAKAAEAKARKAVEEEARRVKAAEAEARRAVQDEARRARAAQAAQEAAAARQEAREAARAEARQVRAARAEARQRRAAAAAERRARAQQARAARAAQRKVERAEAERARAAQADGRRAARVAAREVARPAEAGTRAVGWGARVGGVVQPLLVVVVLAGVVVGAAGWRSGGGPDTQAGEVAVVRAAGGTGGGLVAQDPRVGPISPVHALAVGAWLHVTEAKASLEGTVREARVPGGSCWLGWWR